MKNFKFNLGDKVKDQITGFEGIVTCCSMWLTGCNTYGIKPLDLKDGKPQESVYLDEPQLELMEEKVIDLNRGKAANTENEPPGEPEKIIQPPNRF